MQLTECGSPPSAADVQEVLPHLTPKQLADAVWCFAQHEVKPTAELMDAVAQEIHSKLAHFRCGMVKREAAWDGGMACEFK